MYTGQVLKLVSWSLCAWNSQFMLELPRCGDPDAELLFLDLLLLEVVERMRLTPVAAGATYPSSSLSLCLEKTCMMGASKYSLLPLAGVL